MQILMRHEWNQIWLEDALNRWVPHENLSVTSGLRKPHLCCMDVCDLYSAHLLKNLNWILFQICWMNSWIWFAIMMQNANQPENKEHTPTVLLTASLKYTLHYPYPYLYHTTYLLTLKSTNSFSFSFSL